MIPMYNTKTFNDIYSDSTDFLADYNEYETSIGNVNKINADRTVSSPDKYVDITWTLLTARYGNTPIANLSESQFKMKLFSIMFQYAPTWAKRLEMQTEIRDLTLNDLKDNGKYITNIAANPQTSPSTQDLTEIGYIDQQSTNNQLAGVASAYAKLMDLLKTDVCDYYLDCFKVLFKKVLVPDVNYIYITEDEED